MATSALARYQVLLSPFSLVELDLLVLSGRIMVKDHSRFLKCVQEDLERYGVELASASVSIHVLASELREKHGLKYFDSLHYATAVNLGLPILSSDKAYGKLAYTRWVDLASVL